MTQRDAVIRDIGYRGYEGPRAGRAGILGYLVRHGLSAAFGGGRSWKGKVMPAVCLVLICAPMLIASAIMLLIPVGEMEPVFHPARVPYAFYTVVSLFAAVAAPTLFSTDLRSRSIVHYLSRPLSRVDYVLARLGALVLALVVLQGSAILIGAIGWLLASGKPQTVLGAAGVGLLGALLLSAVVGTLSGLVAALTPRRGVATAVILGLLLVLGAVFSAVTEALKSTGATEGLLARFSPMVSPSGAVERVVRWLTGNHELTAAPDELAAATYLVAVLAGLVLGGWLLVRRYRRVS
ncbi:ABC-2 type transport system permease protein [Kytococcus aerolatus]|uniref:ABC-2 type transport system permease protein n=1 Tax=Kytococcus aerolatus TaxID=592308 RepID=A0A212U7W1_9MICO|nr:ABC transporter permease subunit [Kytococcus aerolatus]SNC74306.1 ABC-2 type transport system permease protein [Kytococcus aerolatus]